MNARRFLRLLTLTLALVSPAARAAVNDAGSNAADFLRLNAGASAAAQGEAFAGRGGGVEVFPYNPAGLRWLDRTEIMLQHNEYLADMRSEYIAGATHAGRFSVAASIHYFDEGDFTRRTISQPNGAGRFGASSWMGSLGFAAPLTRSFSVGAEGRFFQESIDNATRSGGAANIGLHFRSPETGRIEIGAVVRNLGPTVKFDRDEEKLPLEYAVGVSAAVADRLRLSSEVAFPRNQNADFKAGADLSVVDGFHLRVGYNTRNDLGTGLSLGGGLVYRNINFDYAWVGFRQVDSAHRFALTIGF